MPSIIKTADYFQDAVLVVGGQTRRFVPAHPSVADAPPDLVDEPEEEEVDLVSVREEAVKMLAEAAEQAETLWTEAKSRGYEEGLAAGLKAAEEQSRSHVLEIANLARSATIERDQLVRGAQQELCNLALAIAAKVIHREIAADPGIVMSMVEASLRRLPPETFARILVNPGDLDLVNERWSGIASSVPLGLEVEIAADERVGCGGCIVETREGKVDARIETQIARIAEEFGADR